MLMIMMRVESISKLALFELKDIQADLVFLVWYIALQDNDADDDADDHADNADDDDERGIYFKIGSL